MGPGPGPGVWARVPGSGPGTVWYQVTRYLVPGTPGTWYQVPGTTYLVPGTWYQVPGTRVTRGGGATLFCTFTPGWKLDVHMWL